MFGVLLGTRTMMSIQNTTVQTQILNFDGATSEVTIHTP